MKQEHSTIIGTYIPNTNWKMQRKAQALEYSNVRETWQPAQVPD